MKFQRYSIDYHLKTIRIEKMHLPSDLVLFFGVFIMKFLLNESASMYSYGSHQKASKSGKLKNDNKDNKDKQLIIYDPRTGDEMNPTQYLPVILGNKRKPLKPNDNLVDLPQLWNPCTCADFRCTCCLGIRFGDAFNSRVCVSVEYSPTHASVELRILYNRRVIAQFGFSARNPPAYCIPILMPFPVFACLRLYNIRAIGGNVELCISLMLKVLANTIFEFHFDCIRFGVGGVRFFKRGQLEMDTSLEDDDDENILKGDEETRQNIRLEENYSGISVESDTEIDVPIRKGNKGRK